MPRHSRNTDNCHCAHSAGNVKLLSLELLSRVFERECYTAWARGICRVLICWLLHWLSSEPPQEPRQIPSSLEHLLFTPVMGREGAVPKHLAYWGFLCGYQRPESQQRQMPPLPLTCPEHPCFPATALPKYKYQSGWGGGGSAASRSEDRAEEAGGSGLPTFHSSSSYPLSFSPFPPPPVPFSSPALIRPPSPPSRPLHTYLQLLPPPPQTSCLFIYKQRH